MILACPRCNAEPAKVCEVLPNGQHVVHIERVRLAAAMAVAATDTWTYLAENLLRSLIWPPKSPQIETVGTLALLLCCLLALAMSRKRPESAQGSLLELQAFLGLSGQVWRK
jgi:hypothetical protein